MPHSSWRALRVLFVAASVLAFGGVLPVAGQQAPPQPAPPAEPSEPPARDPMPGTEPTTETPELEITELKAGKGPYVWLQPNRIASTFVTNTAFGLDIVAVARLEGKADIDRQIEWEVQPPAGFALPAGAKLKGGRLNLRLTRPKGNPTGAGEPLALTVIAKSNANGRPAVATMTLRQDLRDRLRQEYVDLERTELPDRSDFLDAGQFADKYAKKYPSVDFAEMNWSQQPGTDDRYPFILATEDLVRVLHRAEKFYERPIVVSSAFRNPVKQVQVHASVDESHHQYGRAADLYVTPDYALPHTGRKLASETDWLWLAGSTLRAGGVWIEPLLDSGPNTDLCHVHVDVRKGGPRSSLIEISGEVKDTGGSPLGGAAMTLAGMTTWSNPKGRYLLRHVLTPDQYAMEVNLAGRASKSEMVTVAGQSLVVNVEMPGAALPTLSARLGETRREPDGVVEAVINVKNIGASDAKGVRVQAMTPQDPSATASVLPELLSSLGPQAEMAFRIRIPLAPPQQGVDPARQVPLELTLSYLTPSSDTRVQKVSLTAEPTVGAPDEPPPVDIDPVDPDPAADPKPARTFDTDLGVTIGIIATCLVLMAIFVLTRRRQPTYVASVRLPGPPDDAAGPSRADEG